MKHSIRVFLICLVLVGGTAIFAYELLNKFNVVFDDLSASGYAMALQPIPTVDKADTEQVPTSTSETIPATATSTDLVISTDIATSTDLTFSFIFPKQDSALYFGCTYKLSFESSTTVHSLATAVIDAGTLDTVEQVASGLAMEHEIEPNTQSVDWKVGVAWPGEYSISASNINGTGSGKSYSAIFTIKMMPKGISAIERLKICEESNSL
ncbi:hypothetical protein KJ781_02290 [Patescibacteria group bacterium]|nr:hypothetical protein [Patescibacteria group bacterium]MBU1448494.1 hypothetical protein [Patescibacteria group bacterium]MBU2613728.1 hypothetical protein [Patescibacteria group bacterium]